MPDFGTPYVSSSFSRVTTSLARDVVLGNLRRNQEEILRVQEQLSTGFRILRPSDDPVGANRIMDFSIRIRRTEQYLRNIEDSGGRLAVADSSLDQMNELLNRAREIALTQVQSTSSAQNRTLAAQEITQLLREAINVANSKFEDRYLFGGSRTERAPFVMVGSAVAFVGDLKGLQTNISDALTIQANISADDAFGAFSDELLGRSAATGNPIDLNPSLTGLTKLSALKSGDGVSLGSLQVTGPSGTATIDLTIAETVSDVIDLINAKTSTTGVTAAINAALNGLTLTAAGTITVQEALNGSSAAQLGILTSSSGVASPLVGTDLDPALTLRTTVGSLLAGAGISSAGMTITQTTPDGPLSATFGASVFAATNTVEQVLNAINGSQLFVEARISETGTGIDIVSRLSGSRLTIAETTGTTAAALGLQTTVARTSLANLNGGSGVASVDGSDIRVVLKNGTVHLVDVDSVTTVQQLVTALDNLAGLDAVINGSGGITLTDVSGGAGSFTVENYNGSFAASNLGIQATTAGASIVGSALSFVGEQVDGIFTALLNLRSGLQNNTTSTINLAGQMIDRAQENLLGARTETGARVANLELTGTRLSAQKLELEQFRSVTRDVDLAEAATRFQMQQTVLESALAVAARVMQTSIFDYL